MRIPLKFADVFYDPICTNLQVLQWNSHFTFRLVRFAILGTYEHTLISDNI